MPITTPRDTDTILDSMDETTRLVDPAIDTKKGPLSVLYYSHAVELSKSESFAGYLQQVFQLSRADEQEDDDLFQLGRNYGLDANVGSLSKTFVHFFRFDKPPEDEIVIAEAGTQVSTTDGRFVYVTIDDAEMDGRFAEVFFNAEEQRYEVAVEVEAVAVGVDYDLPENTINTIVTPIEGFDGVTNKRDASRGGDPVDKSAFRDIIWDRLQGINVEVNGALISLVQDVDPGGFDDVAIVPSSDFSNFRRLKTLTEKMGYDVYLISDKTTQTMQSGAAAGGETSILIERRPLQAVQFVVVDGQQVPFTVQLDQDQNFRGSALARDRVILQDPLLPAHTFEIGYTYFDVVFESHSILQDRNMPFGADVLVRLADQVQVLVAGRIKSFSTADRTDVIEELQAFTEGFFRNPDDPSTASRQFILELDPSVYQRAAEQTINGLSEFQITSFARLDSAFLDVEFVSFDGMTEYPVLFPEFDIR